MDTLNYKFNTLIFSYLIVLFSCTDLIAQETFEQKQRRYNETSEAVEEEKRRRKQQELRDGDDGGFLLLGLILIGDAIYSASQSSSYNQSRYYNSRYRRRFVPRPPAFILSAAIPVHKTRINDHWQQGVSTEFKAEFLLFGTRGRYPNIGLYANASISKYIYIFTF